MDQSAVSHCFMSVLTGVTIALLRFRFAFQSRNSAGFVSGRGAR